MSYCEQPVGVCYIYRLCIGQSEQCICVCACGCVIIDSKLSHSEPWICVCLCWNSLCIESE